MTHLRKQLFIAREKIASGPVLVARFVACTRKFRCEYSRLFIASTREFERKISRASSRVVTHMSRTCSSMILACDFAGHPSHLHTFVNLRLSTTVYEIRLCLCVLFDISYRVRSLIECA